jgi:hypothetical protein
MCGAVLECMNERGVRVLHSSEHGARPPGRGHGVGGTIGRDWLRPEHG